MATIKSFAVLDDLVVAVNADQILIVVVNVEAALGCGDPDYAYYDAAEG